MSTIALDPEITPAGKPEVGIGTARAFALALLTETIILIAVVTLLAHSEHEVKHYTPATPLTIVNEPTPPKPVEKPKPPEPKPIPKPVVHKVVMPKPVVTPTPPKPEPVPTPLPKSATPTAFTTPPSPPPPPPQPQPDLSAQQKALADYAGQVHAAVQAAVYYPPAAITMHFSGRTLVEFHLMNTSVSSIHVVTSSGLGLIDNAALQAVQSAQYPMPPASLRDKDQTFRVWVELSLNHGN